MLNLYLIKADRKYIAKAYITESDTVVWSGKCNLPKVNVNNTIKTHGVIMA